MAVGAFRLLLAAALAAGVAGHLAAGFSKVNPAEIEAMKKEVEKKVAARKAGTTYVPPPPPLTKRSAGKGTSTGLLERRKAATVPPPPPLEAAPRVVQSASPRRARPLAVVMKASVPVVAVAGVFAWRAWREQKLAGSLKDAWRDLQTAAGAAAAKATPALPAGLAARRELLASLRRRSALVGNLLPEYAALELKPPADLWCERLRNSPPPPPRTDPPRGPTTHWPSHPSQDTGRSSPHLAARLAGRARRCVRPDARSARAVSAGTLL